VGDLAANDTTLGGELAASTLDCAAPVLIGCDFDIDVLVDLYDFATLAFLYGLTSTNVPPECIPE
jgi:hypothetical protein